MARPNVKEEEKRTVQVNIRLTKTEYEKVCTYATASGLSPANWMRHKIFTGKFPDVKLSPIDAATYQELHKIGVNLNQVTHRINRREMPADYLLVLTQLSGILKRIIKLLLDDGRSSER